ncbi:MAG: dTDP-glucose 4,6-dehydratase [Gammaproteobacteria bacterium]|jgi:dTDP-glucose 4,6-dehydratase
MENNVLIAGDAGEVRRKLASLLARNEENRVYCVELLTRIRHHPVAMDCSDPANSRVSYLAYDDTEGIAGLIAELNPHTIINLSGVGGVAEPNDSSARQAPLATATRNLLEGARHAWLSRATEGTTAGERCYLQVSTALPVDADMEVQSERSRSNDDSRELVQQPGAAVVGQCLARQWSQYHGLPTINVSVPNSFGPDQNRDQFFPRTIESLLQHKPLRFSQCRRDWAFVEDIVDAIAYISEYGQPGEHYRVDCDKGEQTDIAIAEFICDQLDQLTPRATGSYRDYVQAVLPTSISDNRQPEMRELGPSLGWQASNDFHCSLAATVRQYVP